MSEEEKKAVNYLKDLQYDKEYLVIEQRQAITTILNLIEKQQKEIDELRKENIKWKESAEYNYEQYQDIGKSCFDLQEIEQSHQEENGKLRVELTKQEKMIEILLDLYWNKEYPRLFLEYGLESKEQLKKEIEKKAEESE